MTDMIEELFYGRLDLAQMRPKEDSDYRKAHQKISEIIEGIEPLIGKKNMDYLENAILDLEAAVSKAYFTIGFQWGAKMVLSIFGPIPDAFGYEESVL